MKLSILINCYNYEAYVGAAIESALAQTHADTEVVVVDDGSTDGSRAVIERYAGRIKIVFKANGGQGSAYNAGFANACGEVVIFLDADDWLYPQAGERIATAWRAGVSKVQFQLDMVGARGQSLGRRLPRQMDDTQALARLLRFGTYGTPPGSGNAYGADFLRRVLPMDERAWRIAADSVPVLLAPAHGEVVSLREPLGAYRIHQAANPASLVFNNAPRGLWSEYDRMAQCKELVQTHLAQVGRRGQGAGQPLLLAPWEARFLALCLRFGGPRADGQAPRRLPLMGLALKSMWHWPDLGVAMRLAQCGWMAGVWVLPSALARRVGRLDRSLKGAPGG